MKAVAHEALELPPLKASLYHSSDDKLEQPELVAPRQSVAPRLFLLLAALFMLTSATFDTISTKAANRVQLPPCDQCAARYFEAPMFQVLIFC